MGPRARIFSSSLALCAIGVLAYSNPGWAFPDGASGTRWFPNSLVSVNIDPDSCGAASPWQEARNRNAAIRRALASWTQATVPGSAFPWGEITETRQDWSDIPRTNNYVNEITFRVLPAPFRNDAGIILYRLSPDTTTCHGCPGPYFYMEADIILNSLLPLVSLRVNVDQSPADGDSGYTNLDLEGVVRHELGHFIGLYPEEWREVAVMTASYSFGGQGEPARLHADDRNGLRWYYPAAFGAETDLAICGWEGPNLAGRMTPVDDPWPTDVQLGGAITARYVFENMGTQVPLSAQARYYLSSDPVIEPSDSLILTWTFGVLPPPAIGGPGVSPWALEFPPLLEIPCRIPPGTYYLGVLISADGDTIASNNALVFPNAGAPKSIHIAPATSK